MSITLFKSDKILKYIIKINVLQGKVKYRGEENVNNNKNKNKNKL